LVLGYNNDDLINARSTNFYDRFITHKFNINHLPNHDFADIVRE